MSKVKNLTEGPILSTLLVFALPMMVGNYLQQIYNIADTLIVGRYVGPDALAAVGSAYSLMTFLTSLVIGICMGSGALFSAHFGAGNLKAMKKDMWLSACLLLGISITVTIIVFPGTDWILHALQIPEQVYPLIRSYVRIIFSGITFVTIYNFFAFLLRSVGNSVIPLYFLAFSSVVNILLDLYAVVIMGWGVEGAALATVASQAISGIGIAIFTYYKIPELRLTRDDFHWDGKRFGEIFFNDIATGMQQSVMNFGILMIQGLVNTFGPAVMAAFAATVKIDTLAYMPAKEFGNAYSLFVSQNYGAKKNERIRKGTKQAFTSSILFCIFVSVVIFFIAEPLMLLFVDKTETAIIAEGVRYLHIEGAMYWGIGCLQLWYGYFRGSQRPQISLILTFVSLGTRVALSYALAHNTPLGVVIIWAAIPIGWALADFVGFMFYLQERRRERAPKF